MLLRHQLHARSVSSFVSKSAKTLLTIFLILLTYISAAKAQVTEVVGATSGQVVVSPSGGAHYSLPIAVPIGTTGVQPKIALQYNSQASNGLLGVGWSVLGQSTISRCPTDNFFNNPAERTSTWAYDTAPNGIGKLHQSVSGLASQGGSTGNSYDTLNRVTNIATDQNGSNLSTVLLTYSITCNVLTKSDVGTYTYGQVHSACTNGFAGPDAVTTITGTKNATYC